MSRMLCRATLASLLALAMAAPVLGQDAASTPSPVEPGAWQVATVSGGTVPGFRAIVPWDGGFAALGWPANAAMEDQSRDVPVWLSEDGSDWQASEDPIRLPSSRGMATHLVAVDGELMAFGSAGQRLLVWDSEDGQRWQRSTLRAVGLPKGYNVQVADAAAADGRVVVSGLYGMAGDNPWFGRVWASVEPDRCPSGLRSGGRAGGLHRHRLGQGLQGYACGPRAFCGWSRLEAHAPTWSDL